MDTGSMTPHEVAEILNVNVYTVHGLLRSGRLRGFKIVTHWRVTHEALEEFMGRPVAGVLDDNV